MTTTRDLFQSFAEAVYDTDRERALGLVRAAVENGLAPETVVHELIVPLLDQRSAPGTAPAELSLAQHFMMAQIVSEVMEVMLPSLNRPPEIAGTIVIGTAEGDLHTLGKRIVVGCLKARMIRAVDLGVNVSPETFVNEAVAHQAEVIGISAMMVHTATGPNGCLRVRQLLAERQLEGRIRIIVGGAPFRFDAQLYRTVRADAWAADGVAAGRVIADLIKEVRS